MKSYFTVDVELDLHSKKDKGVLEGIPNLLKLFEENKIRASFFVVGSLISKYPKIMKSIVKNGHELGIHGYSHRRFDSLTYKEKEEEIKKSIKEYKSLFKKPPKIFRAPQHSLDKETLIILEKYGFTHDSSMCTGNIMLLRHLFKKKSKKLEIIRNFFGRIQTYNVSKKIIEVPRASPILSMGGFELKVYPIWIINIIFNLHRIFNIPINFVMHSWDLVDLPESRTSRYCDKKKFVSRLEYFINRINKIEGFNSIQNENSRTN